MDRETIIVGLVSAGLAVAAALLTGAKKVIDEYASSLVEKMKRKRYSHGLIGMAQFVMAFESLADLACVERYMLMEGKDSGGLPEPGKPYTVRCLYGGTKVKDKEDPTKLYGFDLKTDSHYLSMLNTVVSVGHVRVKRTALELCLLKSYYEAEGVAEAVVAYVGIVENRLLYVSLARYSGEFSETEMTAIGLGLQRLIGYLNG